MLLLLAFNSIAGLGFAIEKLEVLALNLGKREEMRTQLDTVESTIHLSFRVQNWLWLCPLEFKTAFLSEESFRKTY